MLHKYNIYTEDGKFITSIDADDLKVTSDGIILVKMENGLSEVQASIPINWAAIAVQ
jgi:hypothetical protein